MSSVENNTNTVEPTVGINPYAAFIQSNGYAEAKALAENRVESTQTEVAVAAESATETPAENVEAVSGILPGSNPVFAALQDVMNSNNGDVLST